MSPSFFVFALAGGSINGGAHWSNLFWVLLGVAVLMLMVRGLGEWLARGHPVERRLGEEAVPAVEAVLTPEVMAVIATAVHATLGAKARVAGVTLATPSAPSVESLMLAWSLEGRRQIYSSHKVR
ncbi:MAG: hypothetical protein U1F61_11220 [Opitutaceae bacterium]